MRVMRRMLAATYGLSVTSIPTRLKGEPSGPITYGTTYIVRPFITPSKSGPTRARASEGAIQLLVGPASRLSRLAMKVRCSVRATSEGWLRWSVQPGAAVGCRRRSVPSATMPSTSRRLSSSDASPTRVPAGAAIIDLSSSTVLPGLVDSHTHVFLQGEDPKEGGYDAQLLMAPLALRAVRAAVSAHRALEQGFTTIRDVETEGAGYGDVGIKEAIEKGYIPGPRMLVVTRAISTTGGYPLEGYAPEVDVPKGAQLVAGPVEARKAARQQP